MRNADLQNELFVALDDAEMLATTQIAMHSLAKRLQPKVPNRFALAHALIRLKFNYHGERE